MGGLFSALHNSSTALEAFGQALGVSQKNLANSTTPGYAAQRAAVRPIGDTGSLANGTGDLVQLSSSGSNRADALVQAAQSRASSSQTTTEQLTPVTQLFDITGSGGILAAFQTFSSAFSSLSVSPNDPTLRAGALSAVDGVATAFRQTASSLDQLGVVLDSEIQSSAGQINGLATQIASLNRQAVASDGTDAAVDASLRSALDQLSSLVDIGVTRNSDGSISVLAGGQLPLVMGGKSYQLTIDLQAAPGAQVTSSASGNTNSALSGKLGTLLDTRVSVLGRLLGSGAQPGSLNTLAAGFASRVNALLSSGTTTSGTAGVPAFSFDATDPTNAARSLTTVASLTPDQFALTSGGSSGQANGIANQLAALPGSSQAADLIGGSSAQDLFSAMATDIGQQLSDARIQSTADRATLVSTQTARAQETGVSLDQEAINVTALQRSYEAAARVVSIIDQLTGEAVNLIK